MIIRKENRNRVENLNMRGGEGTVVLHRYEPTPFPFHSRLFSELELNPGCSIGRHVHEGEYEVFFFAEGEITLDDNGTEHIMRPGDFALCFDGEYHGVRNDTDKPARLYAAIITKD